MGSLGWDRWEPIDWDPIMGTFNVNTTLIANSVFRHKIVTHDILSYAMQHSTEHLRTITTEEL